MVWWTGDDVMEENWVTSRRKEGDAMEEKMVTTGITGD
jgi:hypothetical protein